jgi:hypothetical protein
MIAWIDIVLFRTGGDTIAITGWGCVAFNALIIALVWRRSESE